MKRNQPVWNPPESTCLTLKLYNSLTRGKETFIPQHGNKVLWYSCGPTVYDAAHMGHARSYISFDILRRVMSDYFRYDVVYVMNITDIDDKIIKRARQNYLFEQYKESNNNIEDVIAEVKKAIKHYETLLDTAEEKEKKDMYRKIIDSTTEALKNAENNKNSDSDNLEVVKLLSKSKDVLSEWLDFIKGSEVNENSIFSELPAKYEEEFFEDMKSLNVLDPDVLTRVSEYTEEIIQFISKIIENGFAYESNGSVYFDTIKFDESSDHFYGKLVPEAFGDLKKLQEGEGDLSISSDRLKEKRNPSDFALWKASKPGEPSWESPWGKGRPGWHIECSVMASDILGESLDIHTGGYDLKFPHHDNELAQAEAYFGNDNWVRYFLHSGHLTISGCKMSKSLKNFITIKEALDYHSARQIRLAFLLHSWKDTLDYSPETLDNALHYERTVREFNLNVKDLLRNSLTQKPFEKMTPGAKELHKVFLQKKKGVHEALCDNIDTRSALDHLQDLIRHSNKYILKNKTNQVDSHLLENILSYVLKILRIFGADFEEEKLKSGNNELNFENQIMPILIVFADFREHVHREARQLNATKIIKLCDNVRDSDLPKFGVILEDREGQLPEIKYVDPGVLAKGKEQQNNNFENRIMPILRIFAHFREQVRVEAREIKAINILQHCDNVRDNDLPKLGVRLEDREGQMPAIKYVDPAILAKEKEQQIKLQERKKMEREILMMKQKAEKEEKEALKTISPRDFFKMKMYDKYSKFDDKGLPTHDSEGKELSESQLKKVKKIYLMQEKKYNSHLQSQQVIQAS